MVVRSGLFALLLVAMVSATTAVAQDCFDYDTYLPVIHDEVLADANVRHVKVVGDLLFVACDDDGLRIYDVSTPTVPVLLSHWTGLQVRVSAVVADRCYVGGSTGLAILDIIDPTAPVLLGQEPAVDPIYDLVVRDGIAYVAAWNYGLMVWDVSDPADPHGLLGRPLAEGSGALVIDGQHVFVEDGNSVAVFEISDPANPVQSTSFEVMEAIYDLDLVDGWICAVGWHTVNENWGRLVMVDVRDPAQPLPKPPCEIANPCSQVSYDGDLAFISSSGLVVVDVSDPTAPHIVGDRQDIGVVDAVDVSGELVYAGDYDDWLTMDAAQPRAPAILGEFELDGAAHGVVSVGPRTYVACWASGLAILDTGDPTAPELLGTLDTIGLTGDVAVSGGRAYLADNWAGFHVVDVTDPSAPTIIGSVDTPGPATRLQIAGSLAYVADSWGGLQIVDVGFPGSPSIIGSIVTGDSVEDVVLVGDFAVIANRGGELWAIDISEPAAPVHRGTRNLNGECRTLIYHDDWIYVLCADRIYRVELSSGGYMTVREYDSVYGDPRDLVILGQHVFVTQAERGLSIRDFESPHIGAEIDVLGIFTDARNVAATPNLLYVTDNDLGLSILPVVCDTVTTTVPPAASVGPGPRITAIAPNPFNPRAGCRFALDRAQLVTLAVYDLRGRRVRSLLEGRLPAGAHDASWDGRDDHGRAVPAGIYLVHLRGESGQDCRRVSLVK